MVDTLKLGVVGVGVMGSNHARVLSELPGVKLVGVADPDRQHRDVVAQALGCTAFSDADALLRDGVDAVTIAAPTHLHCDIATECSARGIHVLVEKPMPRRSKLSVRRMTVGQNDRRLRA